MSQQHRILFHLSFALLAGSLVGTASAQSIQAMAEREGIARSLASSLTARRPGDILTILIKEKVKIRQDAKVNRSSINSFAAKLESFRIKPDVFKLGLLPDLDVRSSKTQKAQSKQEKDDTFEARMAVVVQDVLPNGNLLIAGTRSIFVDDEEKTLKISGLVALRDISSSNTVNSENIANAKVSITGKGAGSQFIKKGPVGRIVQTAIWLIWPF